MKKDILSVGIDIGTATTSMIVSRLGFQNTAASYQVPDVNITKKEIIYASPLYHTPLQNRELLDGPEIRKIIEHEYEQAKITPADVDTGAVIITGESSLKENAQIIVDSLSQMAGDFVVATAGPDLESILAGRGSGAEEFSKKYGCIVANLDIGGGTTNVSVFDCGNLLDQTCIDAGGQLIQYDEQGVVTYVSPRLNDLGAHRGLHWEEGKFISDDRLREAGALLAETIFASLKPEHGELVRISTTHTSTPLDVKDPISYISFSGGVSDCYYSNEHDLRKYHDLGPAIGEALHEQEKKEPYQVIKPNETIRATVVGAGTYMTEVSGSTIAYTPEVFPIKNLPVYKPEQQEEDALYEGRAQPLIEGLRWFLQQSGQTRVAIGIRGKIQITYRELCALADAVAQTDQQVIDPGEPLVLVCEHDLAKALGQVLRRNLKNRTLICVDRISVRSGDYIDIGSPVMDGLALPVVVKTLIFS